MEFQVLGPVVVDCGTGPVPLGPAKRRSLLAVLLLRAPAAVPVEALTEALWDAAPPQHARTVIQGHVSRLRALLADAGADASGVELATQGRAYALRMPESLLDVRRFEGLVALARGQRDPADTALMLREALALWRGPALTGTVATAPLRAAADALEESRLAAVEQLAATYAVLGEHERAVALLGPEAVAHPLREPMIAALIRARYRAGRQSDALEQYHRTRRALAEELGVDPGPALRAAYGEVLEGGVPLPVAGRAPVVAPPVPELLPRPPRGFHGRRSELAALTSVAGAAASPIALVTGPAGVGKTSLAVHWAHGRAGDYPDGRLFADLRGHGDAEAVVEPADVLREFLLALGVKAPAVPASRDAAAALFRSLVKERRVLVVLDNARDSAQVRPLLPGGADCATVVTSRTRLDGLVASDWAAPVPVDVLGEDAAAGLLAASLGADAAGDERAVREVARLCDGLPLALRIAAARLRGRRHWTVADLAGELSDEDRRLRLLSAEDTGVEAALRSSVARLDAADRALLGALGHSYLRESDVYAAAAAAGLPPAETRAGLDRLTAAHLVQEAAPGRYGLHDLVRLYARSLPREEAAGAVTLRLVDHWLRAQLAAVDAFDSTGYRTVPAPAGFRRDLPVPECAGREAALAWFVREQEALVATVAAAARLGDDHRTWRCGALLWPLAHWRPHPGWRAPLETALAAARRVGNAEGVGRLHATVGVLLTESGSFAEAEPYLVGTVEPLLPLWPEVAAHALSLLGTVRRHLGDTAGSLAAMAEAARVTRAIEHPTATALEHFHAMHVALAGEDYAAAARHTSLCLDAVPELEVGGWRPLIWEAYGAALHRGGRFREAREALLHTLAVTEEEDHLSCRVRALTMLGEIAAVLDGPAGQAAYRERAERVQESLTTPSAAGPGGAGVDTGAYQP